MGMAKIAGRASCMHCWRFADAIAPRSVRSAAYWGARAEHVEIQYFTNVT